MLCSGFSFLPFEKAPSLLLYIEKQVEVIDVTTHMTYEEIMTELKEAMKSGNTEKRDTLRLLQSALKNHAIDARTPVEELAPADIETVIKKLVKQRKDSITQYQAGGRQDLVAQEETELAILAAYLPAEMTDEALEQMIDGVLAENSITSKADLGKATGMVMKKAAGSVSGDRVREVLLTKLSA